MKTFADHAREWLAARGKSAKAAAIKDEPASNVVDLAPGREVSLALSLGDRWRHAFTYLELVLHRENDPMFREDGTTYTIRLRDEGEEKFFKGYAVISRELIGDRVRYRLQPHEAEHEETAEPPRAD